MLCSQTGGVPYNSAAILLLRPLSHFNHCKTQPIVRLHAMSEESAFLSCAVYPCFSASCMKDPLAACGQLYRKLQRLPAAILNSTHKRREHARRGCRMRKVKYRCALLRFHTVALSLLALRVRWWTAAPASSYHAAPSAGHAAIPSGIPSSPHS